MPAKTKYKVGWLGNHPESIESNLQFIAVDGWKFVSMTWYPDRETFIGVFIREVEGD